MDNSRPLFLYFRLFCLQTVSSRWLFNKSYPWLDSNPGRLVSEATALSTVPQPLSRLPIFYTLDGTTYTPLNALISGPQRNPPQTAPTAVYEGYFIEEWERASADISLFLFLFLSASINQSISEWKKIIIFLMDIYLSFNKNKHPFVTLLLSSSS